MCGGRRIETHMGPPVAVQLSVPARGGGDIEREQLADSPILGPSGLIRPWKPVAHRGLQPGTPQALPQGKGVAPVLRITGNAA